MNTSLVKYKDLALKVVYYTKRRQLGTKIFFATSKFQDVLQYFEKNLKDPQTYLKSCYFLNGKQIYPNDTLLYYCTVDPNLRLVEEDLFIEVEELEHLDDSSEPIYETLLKPLIDPFKLLILNIKDGILQMVDFPKEKITELGLDTINNNYACCNSTDSLYISCGKNFWIIPHNSLQIERKEMPFFKEKHSMTYILSNNTIFIAGGSEESFYYDINSKEFITWGKMDGVSEKPALIQYGDFLYSFNSFNQNGIYFEKTKLTNPAKKWEKMVPQSGDQESGFFYNKLYGVSKCSGGNILFAGGVNNQLRTFIYNIKLNVLYINPSKDESILLNERTFYKIDHNFSIGIPNDIEKDHVIALANKNTKSLNLVQFEQIGIKTRNDFLKIDSPRNRLPGNVVIQCRYMSIKDYENFLKQKVIQQKNKTKNGFDIYNRKELGNKKFGDKINGDPYRYQHRGKTPALERINEGKSDEEDDEDLGKNKSNSAKKDKRTLDLGLKLDNIGKFNFSTQTKEEVKNIKINKITKDEVENEIQIENKENVDLNIKKNEIVNNYNIKNIIIDPTNNNNLSNNDNINNNHNNEKNKKENEYNENKDNDQNKDNKNNIDIKDNEINEDNDHNCHSDLEPEEMHNVHNTFTEIKNPKNEESKIGLEIEQNKNDDNKKIKDNLLNDFDKEKTKNIKKMANICELKQKQLNLNLGKKEEGKNNEYINSDFISSLHSNLEDIRQISKNDNIIINSQIDDIKKNYKRNNFKNKKEINNNMSNSYSNKREMPQNLFNSHTERNKNATTNMNNNFNKINLTENESNKLINYNISNNIESNEKININNNIQGNKFPINQMKKRNISPSDNINNIRNNYSNIIFNNNELQRKMINTPKNHNTQKLKSNQQNPKDNNVIYKSNTTYLMGNKKYQIINNRTNNNPLDHINIIDDIYSSSNPFIDNSKYHNIGEKESLHLKEEIEPIANKILTTKDAKTIKAIIKSQKKSNYKTNTVTSLTNQIGQNQNIINNNMNINDKNDILGNNNKSNAYKSSTHRQAKGKKFITLNPNSKRNKIKINNNETENTNLPENQKSIKLIKNNISPNQKNRNNFKKLNYFRMEGNLNKEMYIINNKSLNFETQRLNTYNSNNISSNIINYNKSQKIMKSNKYINNQHNLSNDKIKRTGNNTFGNKNIIITKDGKRYVLDKIVQRVRKEDDDKITKIDERRIIYNSYNMEGINN